MSKFRKLCVATAMIATAAMTVAVPPANAVSTKITASPKTGLSNGTTITLKGSGYLSNVTIYVVECRSKTVSTCDTDHLKTVQTNAQGKFTLRYTVFTGAACRVHHSCYIAGGDAAQVRTAAVKVTFS